MFQPVNRLVSRLIARLMGRSSSRIRKALRNRDIRKKRALLRECLESRAQMAADISIAAGVLTINADSAGTTALVFDANPQSNATMLVVTTNSPNGVNNRSISKNGIVSIRFNGSDQADRFTNATNYRSLAYGYGGHDLLAGGSNVDTLWGQNGDDTIRGGSGNDLLYGGNDSDVLEGQNGNDTMYGHAGNDHLFGGSGDDGLYGGAGMDGLYGDAGLDTYNGGSGGDRMIINENDPFQFLADFSTEDVNVYFAGAPARSFEINGTMTEWEAGQWSANDILQVDKALEVLARRTGNNVLLTDVDGDELTFLRHGAYSDDNPGVSYSAYNQGGDMYFSDSVFTSDDNVLRIVVHEIAHNWDSAEEVDMRLPGQGSTIIGGFQSLSGWSYGTFLGEYFDEYAVSRDNEWSYLRSAPFARDYGKTNPHEDFATCWEKYFLDYDDRPNNLNDVGLKWLSQHVMLNWLSEVEFDNSQLVGLNGNLGNQLLAGRPQISAVADDELAIDAPDQLALNIAPTINFAGGTISVQGTDRNDHVTVNYVIAPGGAISAVPTAWIRVRATNENGMQVAEFPTLAVQLVTFAAHAGNDTFSNQTLVSSNADGGLGNDVFNGGGGIDRFYGGPGADVLNGGAGNDVLDGQFGNDQILGGTGDDYLVGGFGEDVIHGGTGDDHLIGLQGNDTLNGDVGNDILEGRDGNDFLSGGDGRDLLIGGLGSDVLQGGTGDDILIGDGLSVAVTPAALTEIWREWTSDHEYGIRVRNIIGTEHPTFALRLNGDSFLVRDQTIMDDGAVDTLLGQGDRDLFFVEIGFDVTDRAANEVGLI